MERSPPERDVLLATKLQVPRSRPGLVPRQQITRVRVTTIGAGQEGWKANVPATVTWRQR